MARRRWIAGLVVASGLWGCGGGGGGGGSGLEAGPAYWGIPYTTTAASQRLFVTFHNLEPASTTASLSTYAYDGTLGGGGFIDLDGFDSETLEFGGTPTIAWLLVSTPSRTVEVSFSHVDDSGPVDEASRAFPLEDLLAPPTVTTTVVPIVLDASTVRLTNATAAPVVVAATAYPSPALPGDDAVASSTVNFALNAFQTTLVDPDTFGAGFFGQLALSAPTPFFAATVEGTNDLAFDGVPPVRRRDRILDVRASWGLDHAVPTGYTDFSLILSNTSEDPRTVDLTQVRLADGTPLLFGPRSISLGAHETAAIGSDDPLFSDLFGDVFTAAMLTNARFELFVPAEVDVSLRQFDPAFLVHLATMRPQPTGHVVDVLGVRTDELLSVSTRQWITIHNPTPTPLNVAVGVIVPQPEGFDSAPTPVATLTVPPNGFVETSPDGVTYLDRDGIAADFVALRLTCPTAFALSARRETRTANGLLIMLSPLIVRSHDDAD